MRKRASLINYALSGANWDFVKKQAPGIATEPVVKQVAICAERVLDNDSYALT